jgi:hypothetical protein
MEAVQTKLAIGNTVIGVWTDYTTVWTASTTNPAIGNGHIDGRYCRTNNLVVFQGIILMGTTTTYGSGVYRISLPINARSANGAVGYAILLDASAGYTGYTGVGMMVTTSTFEFRIGNAQTIFSPTTPITLNNGDQLRFTLIYEAA